MCGYLFYRRGADLAAERGHEFVEHDIYPEYPEIADTVTVTEDITIFIPELTPGVSDSISVSEDVTIFILELAPFIYESITATESETVSIQIEISVNDAITATEFVEHDIYPEYPDETDFVTVTEDVTIFLPILTLGVNDVVTATESIATFFPTLNIGVYATLSDAVTLEEVVSRFKIDPIIWYNRKDIPITS